MFVAVAVRPGGELPEPPAGSWREVFSAPGVLLLARA